MWSYGGYSGGFVGGLAFVSGAVMPGFGYGYWGAPRPLGFYSGWYGFQSQWAGYMGWMEHTDYCVWHGWQQMLGGMSIGASEQRHLLEGMLQQKHGDMNRREFRELTERILKMNRELGAGDDGRVKEVTETTTTTTTTTSTVTQQQRHDTANDFLQLLASSGGMGFTLKQAKQKAEDIRQGRQDTFVTTHLEGKAAKQQAIQAQPVQQAPPQQPPPQIQTHKMQQQVYSPPPPQPQQVSAQNQQFVSQQAITSPPPQVQVQSPPLMVQRPQSVYSPQFQQAQQQQQQLYTSQQSQANIQSPAPQIQQSYQSMQSTPVQSQTQVGGGYNQQLSTNRYVQTFQSLMADDNSMTTTSTSTTTTTTDTMTSAMQGISLGFPNPYQVQSPAPQQQHAQNPVQQYQFAPQQAQAQLQSPQPQQQAQLTYPGYAGQQGQQIAEYNHQQSFQSPGSQAQSPLPVANFNQQTQFSHSLPGVNVQQPPQQPFYAQAATSQQWAQSPATHMQQQMPQQMDQQMSPQPRYQQQQYLPARDQTTFQQPTPSYNRANQYQAA